jgi:LysM repeat protein
MLIYRLFSRGYAVAIPILVCLLCAELAHAEPRTWVVRPGNTLSVLAKRFDIDIDKLRQWNELDDDDIQVGQELVLEPSPDSEEHNGEIYRVARGDTLRRIAKSYNVTVEEMLEWNPGLNPDKIVEGQKLRVGTGSRRILYRIRTGDTLSSIAARNKITVRELVRWNPGIRPDRIRADKKLVIYSKLPPSYSESIGAPNRGRLLNGVRLPPHSAYIIRDRDRVWGTDETIANLVAAFDSLKKFDRKAPRVMVHDISLRYGGNMYGHDSHETGRDADIAYFRRDCPKGICSFKPVSPSDLDVKRQWVLLKYWLRRRQAEAIFIDYRLQKVLYQYAQEKGATKEQLQMWFQYPRGRTFPLGVIRHYPKHNDHIHIRFACHKTDHHCKTFRPLLMRPFSRASVSSKMH